MDPTEIRDIMEVTSKLESAFRHIRFLCGKYMELENGVNSYQPYSEFGLAPMGYPPISNFGQDNVYPAYNNGYPPQPTSTPLNLNNATKNAPIKQPIKPSIKPNFITPKDGNQSIKVQKSNIQQKKFQPPSNNTKQSKPTQRETTGHIQVPPSAYHLFFSKKRAHIRKEYPQLNEKDLGEIMIEVWDSFKPEEKLPYENEWKKLKRNASQKKQQQKHQMKLTASEIAKSIKSQLVK